jgi:tetratricopeptide (TPR) repeat protein
VELAEEAEPHMNRPQQVTWVNRLEVEHDNLRSALAWSIDNDVEIGLRLAGAMGRFWMFHGHFSEGWDWMAKALAEANNSGPRLDGSRAKVLQHASKLLFLQGDINGARALSEESVTIWRQVGDQRNLADVLCDLGPTIHRLGDHAEARALLEESIAIFRQLKDKAGLARSLFWHGHVAWREGDDTLARTSAEEGIAVSREVGDISRIAASLSVLGVVEMRQGHYVTAQASFEESLTLFQQAEDKTGSALLFSFLGVLAYTQGRYEQAKSFFEQSLQLWRESDGKIYVAGILYDLGSVIYQQNNWREAAQFFEEGLTLSLELKEKPDIARCLAGLAIVAEAEEQPERAIHLFGVIEALLEAENMELETIDRFDRVPVPIQADYERHRAAARAALGDEVFEAAYAEGQAMSLEEAVASVLER